MSAAWGYGTTDADEQRNRYPTEYDCFCRTNPGDDQSDRYRRDGRYAVAISDIMVMPLTVGPATWAKKFPLAAGEHQSPINIETGKVQHDKALSDKPLKISYHPEKGMPVSNTGASFKADCMQDSTVSGGPLGDAVYKLVQFHMHWGCDDNKGSEHTVDGKSYPAELHLVHYNTAYKSFEEALNKSDGLAVLGMFVKVGKPHKGFTAVSGQLSKAAFKGNKCILSTDFDTNCLLPDNTAKYWTYPGSLTTPPCTECVQWIVFEEPLEFSADEMKALRSMHFGDSGSECMMDNFRPCLPLGPRTVRSSF